MHTIKKVLVALDLTEMDNQLIKFVTFLFKFESIEEVCFLNVIKYFQFPDEIKKEFPDIENKTISDRLQLMRSQTDPFLNDDIRKIKIDYVVKIGSPAKKIIEYADKQTFDLIIVGRKINFEGSGVISYRLARRATCSLLIVPEGSEPRVKKLLVPVDFTECADMAMQESIEIALANNAEIRCLHVYNVPVGYHYTGKSYEEFGTVMEKHAYRDITAFLSKFDLKGVKVEIKLALDKNDNYVDNICDTAGESCVDLIVMGALGRTPTTAFFLGSMAERLIHLNQIFPLLIIRPKGKSAGIIDYIKEL